MVHFTKDNFDSENNNIKDSIILNCNSNITSDTYPYSGLFNQGNTCYLNSLLQTLFMTPEFRIKVLKWKYNDTIHGNIKDCIPFQLQKLFARLQLHSRKVEETSDLTKSFQWDSNEVFNQHDIQELCRVLFEAIEMSLSIDDENFINYIYEGTLSSIVKCQVCNLESIKKDRFLDISLPIRNEYDKIYNSSLEMALRNFTRPEILDKDNQYLCQFCDKKVNALKYIKFEKTPNIMFIQLNRFEYDFFSAQRKKINDRVCFPLELDFNEFLNDSGIYEIFSIVVHSGGAMNGHYYAYIKSFENNKWYNFNDNIVTELSEQEINKFSQGESNNHDTGYVLVYRRITDKRIVSIDNNIINQDLKSLIESENIIHEEEERKLKEKLNNINLKIIYDNKIKSINIKKTDLICELKNKVIYEFEINDDYLNLRLRNYDIIKSRMTNIYDDYSKTIEDYKINGCDYITLEKKNNGKFEEYNPDDYIVYLYLWNDKYVVYDNDDDLDCILLKINKKNTMLNLKTQIINELNIYDKDIFAFRKQEKSINNFSLVEIFNSNDMNKEIFNEFNDQTKLYIEVKDNPTNLYSKFYHLVSQKLDTIYVRFNFPVNKHNIIQSDYKWDNEIEVNKNLKISEVKCKIANYLNINQDEFIIKKYSHNGSEITNTEKHIGSLTSGNINIFIQIGKPLKNNQLKLILMLCEYDNINFKIYPYNIRELCSLIVDSNITINNLKSIFLEELRNIDIIYDIKETILRDYLNDKPGKIYENKSILSELNFNENKKIIIQKYTREYTQKHNQLQISIRLWNQAEWTISQPIEISIDKKIKMKNLAKILSDCFKIESNNLEIYKVIKHNNIFMDDLLESKFYNLSEISDNCMFSTPFFLQTDGNMFIIKDRSLKYTEPNEDQLKFLCKPTLNKKNNIKLNLDVVTKNNKFSDNKIYTKRVIKEKALSIKVKKNDNSQIDNPNLGKDITQTNKKDIIKNCNDHNSII